MAENRRARGGIRVVTHTPNLRERTTRVLRDAILNMHLKPGERLVERRLCEETGVSRTSLREALRQLESEGLVQRLPNRGLFVASVSPEEARQIYEVREILEAAIGRMFVERASDRELAALDAAYSRVEASLEKHSVLAYVKAFDEFFDVLLQVAGNEIARQVLSSLEARINHLRARTASVADSARTRGSMQRMQAIVDAALARDADATAERSREFVRGPAEFALRVLGDADTSVSGATSVGEAMTSLGRVHQPLPPRGPPDGSRLCARSERSSRVMARAGSRRGISDGGFHTQQAAAMKE